MSYVDFYISPVLSARFADYEPRLHGVTFRDRAHRDVVMAAAMQHKGFLAMKNDAPFDGKRMIWAGFEQFVNV